MLFFSIGALNDSLNTPNWSAFFRKLVDIHQNLGPSLTNWLIVDTWLKLFHLLRLFLLFFVFLRRLFGIFLLRSDFFLFLAGNLFLFVALDNHIIIESIFIAAFLLVFIVVNLKFGFLSINGLIDLGLFVFLKFDNNRSLLFNLLHRRFSQALLTMRVALIMSPMRCLISFNSSLMVYDSGLNSSIVSEANILNFTSNDNLRLSDRGPSSWCKK